MSHRASIKTTDCKAPVSVADTLIIMWTFVFILLPLTCYGNLDHLDIGVEYLKLTEVFYWSSPVTVQLVYYLPRPPDIDDYAKPRCDYAQQARESLFTRFQKQFPGLTAVPIYKLNCDRFGDVKQFKNDTQDHCETCFHITSDNDPYYLECLTLLEMRKMCEHNEAFQRPKRQAQEHFILSNIAVMLAEGAKTQDDRITEKFKQEHHFQKENTNFNLLFLNTFRWELSMSELWFLQYIQSQPELFAKILIHLSGILPETRALTEKQLNSTLSEEWAVALAKRNDTHVAVNVTFHAINNRYRSYLYRFNYFPVYVQNQYFAVNDRSTTYALKCGDVVAPIHRYQAVEMQQQRYIPDSPCHQNHMTSGAQPCMKAILESNSDLNSICLKNAKPVLTPNGFYFTSDNKIWIPGNVSLLSRCIGDQIEETRFVGPNALLIPRCGCEYSADSNTIPKTKTCSTVQNIQSNYSGIGHRFKDKSSPFFLGKIYNDTNNRWAASATNRLTERVLGESEAVENYFRRKLEEEASTSASFKFKFGLSTLWMLLPLVGIVILGGVLCFRCRANSDSQGFRPVFINSCQHPPESVQLRNTQTQQTRVVSWQEGGNKV